MAPAWLLTRGDGVVPIPGTKRVTRVEENAASADLELSPNQRSRLDALQAPTGDRYADMGAVGR